jgi:hypothetical protein
VADRVRYLHQVGPDPVDPPMVKTAIVVFLIVEWTAFAVVAYRRVLDHYYGNVDSGSTP